MKFIHILFALAIITSCSTDPSKKAKESKAETTEAATPTADGPVVTFDKLSHDFGTINEGDVVETVFTLTNTGTSDLIIPVEAVVVQYLITKDQPIGR